MTGKSYFCESQKEQDEVLAELRALDPHVEQMEFFCPTCGSADIEEQTWVRCVTQEVVGGDVGDCEMKVSELIARLMAAVETPDDLTKDDVNCLLEDAHIILKEIKSHDCCTDLLQNHKRGSHYMWCRSCAATELDADFKTADTRSAHWERWKSRYPELMSPGRPRTPLTPEAVLQNLLEACEQWQQEHG